MDADETQVMVIARPCVGDFSPRTEPRNRSGCRSDGFSMARYDRLSDQFPQENEEFSSLALFDLFLSTIEDRSTLKFTDVGGGGFCDFSFQLLERQVVQIEPSRAALQAGPPGQEAFFEKEGRHGSTGFRGMK